MKTIVLFSFLGCIIIIRAQSAYITGHVTCDDHVYFYADGVEHANNSDWKTASPISIPANTQVIAVKCHNIGGPGGIKLALNNGVQTDITWRCSPSYSEGWNMSGFDDSRWARAVVPTADWDYLPKVLDNKADWIWTHGWNGQDKTVYCRKVLRSGIVSTTGGNGTSTDVTSAQSAYITGHVTCDDHVYFYADGVEHANNSDWKTASPISIPANTQVIAVKCHNIGGPGGIKLALNNGVQTDITWRCSPSYSEGWNMSGFDDSRWARAVVPTADWDYLPKVLDNKADWIWTHGWNGQDKTVYCRKVLRSGIVSTTGGNGTSTDVTSAQSAYITGHVTCDNNLYFYADGVEHVNNNDWKTASPISIPANTQVIAVKCHNTGGPGGIKLALNNGVQTDITWRCSPSYSEGWNMSGFDDSHWARAVVPKAIYVDPPKVLDNKADWIWTDGWNGQDKTVYCRKVLRSGNVSTTGANGTSTDVISAQSAYITGHVTCDDYVYFYADGVEYANYSDWKTASPISIPANTQVIAVKCQDTGGVGGIKLALNNGVQTDITWRCSPSYSEGWNMSGFDDSHWARAVVPKAIYVDPPKVLDNKADWIWTDGWNGQDKTVYCRKVLRSGNVSTTGANGTSTDVTSAQSAYITGHVACDNNLYFYADGVEHVNNNDWKTASPISIPANTQVIAVKCHNTGGPGGIKLALNNGVQTDITWRCSPSYSEGWNMSGFDDSHWARAVVPKAIYVDPPKVLDNKADWIWTDGWNGQDKTVYCRKVLRSGNVSTTGANGTSTDVTSAQSAYITGHVTCDDYVYFYADGVEYANNNDWKTASPISIPANTQVIAVKCQNTGGVGGIKLALNNGVQTDITWRCSPSHSEGWNMPGFDDSRWARAVVPTAYWHYSPKVLDNKADWIWTEGWNKQDKTVYCRKVLRSGIVSTTGGNGTSTDVTSAQSAYITGHVTCDDHVYFYADGVEHANNSDWKTASPISIPANTQVIAVKCQDTGGVGGIKLALNNGVQTDITWRCSPSYSEGWNMPGFDDSRWARAVVPTADWYYPPKVLDNKGDWIWTDGWNGQDKTVYCRKVLRSSNGTSTGVTQDCELERVVTILSQKIDLLIESQCNCTAMSP